MWAVTGVMFKLIFVAYYCSFKGIFAAMFKFKFMMMRWCYVRMSEGVEITGTAESVGSIGSKSDGSEQQLAAVTDDNAAEAAQPQAEDTGGLQHFWM